MATALTKTPSGQSLKETRRLLARIEASPQMRKAIAAAIKAMGLPAPLTLERSKVPRDPKEEDRAPK